jgi:signal transduction histidine kinase
LLVLVCLLADLAFTLDVFGADGQRPKRVLIISTGSRLAPGFIVADQQLLRVLSQFSSGRIETYAENLDLIPFPIERFQQILTEYLTGKYAENPPDIVILVFVGNLRTPATLLPKIFPGTPIIVAGFTEEEIRPGEFGALVSGVVQRVNSKANLDLILRLHPDVERIVIVGGTTDVDQQVLQRVKDAGESLRQRVKLEFWDKQSLAELRHSVAGLPRRTAILFARMFRDGAGQSVISSQVAQWTAAWANGPVYVMSDAALGTGAVGGELGSIEEFSNRAGEQALQVLNGVNTKSIPMEIRADSFPIFDWRALQRWNIPESRLPAGSIVRFRPESIWDKYRWYVVGALVIFALQLAMISDLLLQRGRRRKMAAELSESRQFVDLATEAGDIGLWVRDLIQDHLWTNLRLRSMLGFDTGGDVEVKDVLARINSEDREQMMSVIERAQETGKPFEVEFRTEIAEAPVRWIAARGMFVRGPNGRVLRRMGTMIDVTARKAAEAELQRNRDELAHMTRVSTLGELAASLAHELNQPLTGILSNAQAAQRFLALNPADLDEVKEILKDIVHDDNRASEVIQKLRALYKKETLTFAPLDLPGVVNDVVQLMHSDAVLHNVRIALETDAALPPARGDRVQLQQVVLNLLRNAIDAMKDCPIDDRTVWIYAQHQDTAFQRVAVRDRGAGLTAESLDKIFQPFYTTKRDGLGMGLSISRSIIDAHGGRLWAENNPDRGMTFYFTVPVEAG